MIYIAAVCKVMSETNGADMLLFNVIEEEVEYIDNQDKRHTLYDSGYVTNLDEIYIDKMQEDGWEILTIPNLHLLNLTDIQQTMKSIREVMLAAKGM